MQSSRKVGKLRYDAAQVKAHFSSRTRKLGLSWASKHLLLQVAMSGGETGLADMVNSKCEDTHAHLQRVLAVDALLPAHMLLYCSYDSRDHKRRAADCGKEASFVSRKT